MSDLNFKDHVIHLEDQRVHPFGIFREISGFIAAVFYFFVIDTTFFGLVDTERGRFDAVEIAVSGAFLALGIARYSQRRYSISDEEITLKSGVLLRRVDKVARRDVQSVRLSTPWLYRFLKLTEVTILESSGQSKIELAPLGRDAAAQLKHLSDDLRAQTAEPTSSPAESNESEADDEAGEPGREHSDVASLPVEVIRMRRNDVLRLNTARFVVSAAVLLPAAFFVSQWFRFSPHVVVGLLIITFVSMTISQISFRLQMFGERLEATRGYVSTEADALSLHNIQALHVRRSPIHRVLGLETVKASTAGNMVEPSSMLAPALPAGDWPRVASYVFPDISDGESGLEPIGERSVRLTRVRLSLLVAILAALGTVRPPLSLIPFLAASAALLWYPQRRLRRYGIRQINDVLIVRVGVITERLVIVPFRRVEAANISQSYGQRRRQLATLTFTAAGDDAVVRLPDLDYQQAAGWLKLIVERSWQTANTPDHDRGRSFDSGPRQLPETATKVFRAVSTVESAIVALIGLALLAANAFDRLSVPVAVALAPIAIALCMMPLLWWQADRYRRSVRWRSTDRFVEQRQGVWWERREVVLRRGVFAENRSTGPILRRYDLAAVTLKTSGARSPDLEVRGISATDADLIFGIGSKADQAPDGRSISSS